MKDLVEFVARSLVDDPTQVLVNQSRGGGKVHLELHVSKEDMGRVIGKGGRVANAMRVLLRVAAAREGKQVTLDVIEPR
ncbi:MAG TPA: KH domain-containing protein [Anaerolineaceae bacterium]|nr:KH domain-containing protein [Anaerolineaceae bacterium]